MGQREAVEAEQHAGPRGRVERQRGLFGDGRHQGAQDEADEQPGHDPAERAEYPDQGKLFFLRLDVVECQAVREAERGHVAQVVEQQEHDEHRGRTRRPGHREHHHTAQQVQHAQHLLGREVAVGDEPQEERRDDGRDRVHRVGPVRQRLHPVVGHVHGDRRVPRAPDEELEEHHRRQPGSNAHGSTRILMLRKATRNSCSCKPM